MKRRKLPEHQGSQPLLFLNPLLGKKDICYNEKQVARKGFFSIFPGQNSYWKKLSLVKRE